MSYPANINCKLRELSLQYDFLRPNQPLRVPCDLQPPTSDRCKCVISARGTLQPEGPAGLGTGSLLNRDEALLLLPANPQGLADLRRISSRFSLLSIRPGADQGLGARETGVNAEPALYLLTGLKEGSSSKVIRYSNK